MTIRNGFRKWRFWAFSSLFLRLKHGRIIGESFGIDSKESALPHTGSQTLPTVATIQASTSHVYCQTNLFRGHVDQLLNGQLILGGTQNYN